MIRIFRAPHCEAAQFINFDRLFSADRQHPRELLFRNAFLPGLVLEGK